MKNLIWAVLGVLGLAWSGLAWLLHGLAGAGGPLVVTLTRWFDLEPSSTQWLADGLSMAGGLAQWLVVAVWLLGAVVLLLIGWMSGRAIDSAEEAARQVNRERGYGAGPVLEGEFRSKTVTRADGATRTARPEGDGPA
ncbi:hypothetical protein [Sandaracinobacteroides hominis]|uniref:hypothetical protein n=1 Tax=Sandaracinobacteroides hominis TaxID=2780086 RepID=UPI0018F6D445|nr:hypothetical protein [Sandaracinobacteroides hominis]